MKLNDMKIKDLPEGTHIDKVKVRVPKKYRTEEYIPANPEPLRKLIDNNWEGYLAIMPSWGVFISPQPPKTAPRDLLPLDILDFDDFKVVSFLNQEAAGN